MSTEGCEPNKPVANDDWIKKSRLVSHWRAIKHEIELHKWYESERAGHDIGWDKAAASWQMHYGHLAEEDKRT